MLTCLQQVQQTRALYPDIGWIGPPALQSHLWQGHYASEAPPSAIADRPSLCRHRSIHVLYPLMERRQETTTHGKVVCKCGRQCCERVANRREMSHRSNRAIHDSRGLRRHRHRHTASPKGQEEEARGRHCPSGGSPTHQITRDVRPLVCILAPTLIRGQTEDGSAVRRHALSSKAEVERIGVCQRGSGTTRRGYVQKRTGTWFEPPDTCRGAFAWSHSGRGDVYRVL